MQPQASVHIKDRVANMEAMVTAFVAEKSLSFCMADAVIDLAKELSKDANALQRLHLYRTTVAYKTVYGTSKTMKDELLKKLRVTPFSLNMDEVTSSNELHVCTVLVSYYDSTTQSVVIEHFSSISVHTVNSESLFAEMKLLFKELDIPWNNLLAILMDSASVMRGNKSGLETRIRDEIAPHLLDIDGESCHHMHSILVS